MEELGKTFFLRGIMMERSCFNLMLKRLEGAWCTLFLLLSVAHAQDGTLRQWQAIRHLEPSLVSRQLPVYLDGTIAFSEPEWSFFVLGDPHEGIPVHVIGPYPDIKVGDRVHIEGTTMLFREQPGVRLVAWKKLDNSVEDANDLASVSDFTPNGPFFKKVQVEGLVTSVAHGNGELLIGINRTAAESYLLRIPDRVWERLSRGQVLGGWVKVNGYYLPADPRATRESARNSFAISSKEDILLHQDLVYGLPLNFETLANRLDLDISKAVMVEGELNQLDAYQWGLKLKGGEIMLDWAENTDFSGRRSRCIGFPIKRSGQIVLKPSMVFLGKSETEPDATESAAKMDWEFRSTEYVEPLTTLAEVVALDEEAAKRNRPVDAEVTVTYHHPADYLFFVQDQTDGVYVTTDNTSVEWLAGGTKIRLMGNTVQGFLKHNIQDAEYEILEQGAFPEPIICDLESLQTGDFDARYVVTSGQVREAVRVGNGAQLKILTQTGSFSVVMRGLSADKDPSMWVDSVVTFTGVAGFQYENQKPVGVILYVENESHVEVIRSRPYDVLPPELVSIDRAALGNTPVGETFRVRLNGFLTGKNFSGTWVFQTEEQGFLIRPASVESSLKAGDFLQVIGWPRLTEQGVVIEEAQVTLADAEFELAPLTENDVSELNVDHLHRLISLRGRLIEATSNASRLNFMMQSSSERFAGSLDISDTPGLTSSSFALGSVVRVEGILNSLPGDASIGEVPSLIVRHKKDIFLVSPPNWWTPRRILMALGVTCLAGLAAVTWSFVLRRKVQQQTLHIRQMLVKETSLRSARDEAEKENKAKSEFLSRVSHELRTPLNSIIGFSKLLSMSGLSGNVESNIQRIHKAGLHLLDMIDEVLDISRIESGNCKFSPEQFDLQELLYEVGELVRPMATDLNVTLRFQEKMKPCLEVLADKQRLRQVFLNLASNGIKYNRDHGTLGIYCERLSEDRVRIIFENTGEGIPDSKLKRLFQPFDRLDAERDQLKVEGTGLGLAISKKLVEAMGGKIWARSTIGHKTKFFVELCCSDG